MPKTSERSRRDRLERAGVPAVSGCEFRGVSRSRPKVDTAGRVLVEQRMQLRAEEDDDGPVIEGLGTVYETWAVIGRFWPFREQFAKGAFSKTLADGADVRSMRNHDPNLLLARVRSATLELWEDDDGLHYRAHINPDDPIAMSTHAQVKRGDIDGSSIWFEVVREEWTFKSEDDDLEMDEVIVREAKLHETGPVVFPAYETTTSEARALDAALRGIAPPEVRREDVLEALDDPDRLPAVLERAGVDLTALRARLAGPDDGTGRRKAAEEAPADPEPSDTPPDTRHLSDMTAATQRLVETLT